MAALRNKRKLATINRKNHEEHSRNSQARDTKIARIQEDFITQVSEEIEGKVTKKLSQEISRADSCTLDALSKLNEFLLNPHVRGHSGSTPETSRNSSRENHEPNEDRSQHGPHPEARISMSQSSEDCCPDNAYDTMMHLDVDLTSVTVLHPWCGDGDVCLCSIQQTSQVSIILLGYI